VSVLLAKEAAGSVNWVAALKFCTVHIYSAIFQKTSGVKPLVHPVVSVVDCYFSSNGNP
jgi:hypothetical protein